MKRTRFADAKCPIARTLDVVGDWWSLLIVRDATLGVTRFEDFLERLGIARNILTARLKTLLARGVLERRRYQERPPRHEYVLTEKGAALVPVLIALGAWGLRYELPGPAPVRVIDTRSGEDVEQVFVNRRTGRRVAAAHVRPRAVNR